jgi:hypothetical protein
MGEPLQGIETWIDAIATPFDRAWLAGQRPRIEDDLAGIGEPRRARLLEELLRVEREHRLRLREDPTREEYRRRFPGDAAVIDAVFGSEATGPSRGSGVSSITGKAPDPANLHLPRDSGVMSRSRPKSHPQGGTMGHRVNGIGTWPCKAGYDVGWGADDAVQCFTLFFMPFIPLKAVHIWGEQDSWAMTRAAIIPIRWSGTLVAQVMIRSWSRVFLTLAILSGFVGAIKSGFPSPKDDPQFVQSIWFICVPSAVFWLIGSFWSSSRADRPCKIRILLGPHTFGASDPATWTDDTVAQAIPSLKEGLGAESFAQAAERFLNSQDFRSAMWAARVSTTCEDSRRGERLTDRILEHPRVSEALEKFRPTASFWRRPL